MKYTEKEVRIGIKNLAEAMSVVDNVHVGVHDFKFIEGESATFQLSWGGEDGDGGSYFISDEGNMMADEVGTVLNYGNITSTIRVLQEKVNSLIKF